MPTRRVGAVLPPDAAGRWRPVFTTKASRENVGSARRSSKKHLWRMLTLQSKRQQRWRRRGPSRARNSRPRVLALAARPPLSFAFVCMRASGCGACGPRWIAWMMWINTIMTVLRTVSRSVLISPHALSVGSAP